MHAFPRTLHIGVIVAVLLSTVAVLAGAPHTVHAAGAKTCKTVKKHGKKTRVCTTKSPVPAIPTNPSAGLPSLTVGPQPDSARAVTQTIPASGGSISATGADGTVYTLTFPKDSLVDDQEITMTPLSGVSKLPGGHALAAGVQLDPQGLQLAQPATLTIKPATPIPAQNRISFASQDSGTDFHLYPQAYDPQTITLQVTHFTEYGAFQGAAADVLTQMQHGTLSYLSLSEQLRSMLGAMRASQLTGADSPYTWDQIESKFVEMSQAWYAQKVLPGLQLAVDPNADDDQMSQAIREAMSWEREIQLLGVNDPDLEAKWTTILGMIQQALTNAYARAYNRCVNEHNVMQVRQMMTIEHSIQLMGYDLGPSHDALADAQKCLHFELDVDATYTSQSSGHGSTINTSGHVQVAALPLTLDANFRYLTGSKQIDYQQFTASGGNATCSVTPVGTTLGDPFGAVLALSPSGGTAPKGSAPVPPKITLQVDPGTAKEQIRVSCPRAQYDQVFDYTQFTGLWDSAHGVGHTFTDWTVLGGSTYAKYTSGAKTVSYTVAGDSVVYTMSVTLTLRHTPG